MINAYIVVREEKHIDDRFWVCLEQEDALKIAADVTAYWRKEYNTDSYDPGDIDEELHEDLLFHFHAGSEFRVYVQPQQIREANEVEEEGDL